MANKRIIFELRVSLDRVRPEIWRSLLVAKTDTLDELHDTLQTAMGWESCRTHRFGKILSTRGDWQEGIKFIETIRNEHKIRIKDVLRKPGDRIVYMHDFGESWGHEIELECVHLINPKGGYPWILDGERASPPKDCGGPRGFQSLLEAQDDPEHPRRADWERLADGGFNPLAFNAAEANRYLHGDAYDTAKAALEVEFGPAEDEIVLVDSPLSSVCKQDGYTLDVQIYSSGRDDWFLEVVNEAGTSIVWDEQFETDRLAWEEFERCLREEGVEAFQ